MSKIARDMTATSFAEACTRYGFVREGFMGYYRLPGPGHTCVSIWNAGKRRRDQLAYLIQQNEKHQRQHAAKLLICGGCSHPFNDEESVEYGGRRWHPACVESRKRELETTVKLLAPLNQLMGKHLR